MDIDRLKTFLQVAQLGSFKQVADKEFRSQRTISKQITQLETELNVQLFNRQANQITLTTQGKFFLATAQDVVNNYTSAVTELQKISQGATEFLNVGYFSAFEKRLLQAGLKQVLLTTPNLELNIRNESNEHLTQSIINGQLDLALSISYGQPAIGSSSNLKSLPIFAGEMVMGVSKLNPVSTKKRLSETDLKSRPILYYSPESSTFLLESFLASTPLLKSRENIQRVSTLEQMNMLVALNQAIAFYPGGLIAQSEQEDDIAYLHVGNSDQQHYEIVALYRSDNANPMLQSLLTAIKRTR